LGEPYFVVAIDPAAHRVTLGRKESLARHSLTGNETNWLVDAPGDEFSCDAKIRYNSVAQPARATVLPDNRLRVEFSKPQYGIAPGQAVVLYDGPRVLGGGWIE